MVLEEGSEFLEPAVERENEGNCDCCGGQNHVDNLNEDDDILDNEDFHDVEDGSAIRDELALLFASR